MQRRSFLVAGCSIAGIFTASGSYAHTLYNQWVVYRQKHLVIGSHREDMQTYSLARQYVRVLNDVLPRASARVARAPTAGRLASLLGTAQMDVALLSYDDAVQMTNGNGEFKPYGKIDLTALLLVEPYVLVARSDIPIKHGWLIAHALHGGNSGKLDAESEPPLPWHPGALKYLSGESLTDS